MSLLALSDPKKNGFDPDRLEIIRRWADDWVTSGRLPCLVSAVMRNGKLVFFDWRGDADVDDQTAVTPDSLFRIFSMTKPITSVALMMLVEEGRCCLDDPVHQYIPAFKDMRVLKEPTHSPDDTVPLERPVTLHQLLVHTSGLVYSFIDPDSPLAPLYDTLRLEFAPHEKPLSAWIEDVATVPLAFQPGSRWSYGISTDVLGHVIEIITGEDLEQFFRRRIFQPLGMTDTSFNVPAKQLHRLTSLYKYKLGGGMTVMERGKESVLQVPVTRYQGGSGLLSTVADYFKFLEMMRQGGTANGVRILGRKTVELMTRNHLRGDLAQNGQAQFGETNFSGVGFGLGFSVILEPGQAQMLSSIGEYSWGGAASTSFWIDPQEDICAVQMTQLFPSFTYPIRKQFRALVNQALL